MRSLVLLSIRLFLFIKWMWMAFLISHLLEGGRTYHPALTGAAQLVVYCPSKQRTAGSIPGQGTCLACRFGSWSWSVQEAMETMFLSHMDVSLPLFLHPFPSFKKYVYKKRICYPKIYHFGIRIICSWRQLRINNVERSLPRASPIWINATKFWKMMTVINLSSGEMKVVILWLWRKCKIGTKSMHK